MRIQIMSDLHFEFHADGGACFVESLDPQDIDVLVLAGDIAVGQDLPAALGLLARRYERSHVIYVHGNHEYYDSSLSEVHTLTRSTLRRHRNLSWLENRVLTIDGRRFLGATLWFPHSETAQPLRSGMNDFLQIADFESWVYGANRRTLRWLERSLRPGDVVVTHHLPTPRAVAPAYARSPLNPFFVCDVETLIRERSPALWAFGHTHTSTDFALADTRLVCNPLGYAGDPQNARFDEHLVIEL